MALRVVNTVVSAVAVAVDLTSVDDVVVSRAGVVTSSLGAGVSGSGAAHSVWVDGLISGYYGIYLGDQPGVDYANKVTISSQGTVWGEFYGISLESRASYVGNSGLIEGYVGLSLGGNSTTTTSTLINDGTLRGMSVGLQGGSEALLIINQGTISGGSGAMTLSSQADTLRNLGLIQGDISLLNGSDIYDGRWGTVNGVIYGNNGLDTFRPGASAELMVGGADTDTVDYRKSGAVSVDLDAGLGDGGRAEGDEYQEIEVVYGSTFGSDSLVGDAQANALWGFRGLDTLVGGAGNDTLSGGLGQDSVTGGEGNDFFDFGKAADGGDRILDFRNLLGNDDTIRLSALGFGGGLTAGVLAEGQFVVGNTAAALDSDDRVIWKTTDFTLWFDVNGNAAGGLTLLAKLESGATVTASDIFIL